VIIYGAMESGTAGHIFDMDDFAIIDGLIPVELAAFTGTAAGERVRLDWTTASETGNAGFEVEMRAPGTDAFRQIGFVVGAGTTTESQSYRFETDALAPGVHAFRLRQIDFDGQHAFSPEVEVLVELAKTHALSAVYPNPFNPSAAFTLSVRQPQYVSLGLYDVLGRRVATLFDGHLDASASHAFSIDGSGLASGAYLVRANGERFTASRRVTLLK
jgi:hypothetical protein